jgi:hypothetical protein
MKFIKVLGGVVIAFVGIILLALIVALMIF